MFLSYEFLPHYFDKDASKYHYPYRLVDSEFEERGLVEDLGVGSELVNAIIHAYEKRNLNVAANLARAMIWFNKKLGRPVNTLDMFNPDNQKHIKYKMQLDKYLILV